jgi:hypothetical protein
MMKERGINIKEIISNQEGEYVNAIGSGYIDRKRTVLCY